MLKYIIRIVGTALIYWAIAILCLDFWFSRGHSTTAKLLVSYFIDYAFCYFVKDNSTLIIFLNGLFWSFLIQFIFRFFVKNKPQGDSDILDN